MMFLTDRFGQTMQTLIRHLFRLKITVCTAMKNCSILHGSVYHNGNNLQQYFGYTKTTDKSSEKVWKIIAVNKFHCSVAILVLQKPYTVPIKKNTQISCFWEKKVNGKLSILW